MNELETKLNQIADSLLVQTRLVDRFERRTEERFADHEDRLDRIEAVLEKLIDGHGRLIQSHQSMIESHQRLIESHQYLATRQARTANRRSHKPHQPAPGTDPLVLAGASWNSMSVSQKNEARFVLTLRWRMCNVLRGRAGKR